MACHVDLDLGGSLCGMPGGTLLFVLLLVYNSVSTKLAKSIEKGANFCPGQHDQINKASQHSLV